METLNICVATYSLSKGNGIDVTFAEFARELSKYHNVRLATIVSNMTVPGVEITHYPANKPLRMRAVAKELDGQKQSGSNAKGGGDRDSHSNLLLCLQYCQNRTSRSRHLNSNR